MEDLQDKPKILLEKNSMLLQKIHDLEFTITNYRRQIKENEKIIWKSCPHIWEKDDCSGYDRTSYFCSKCKLWRNHYMYT